MPRISLESIRVSLGGRALLQHIDWRLEPGQHWALLGANGSGKSTLLKLLRGELWPDQDQGGTRLYHYGAAPHPDPAGIRHRFALVSAEQQERYTRHSWNPPVLDVVLSGFFDAPMLYQPPLPAQRERALALLDLLEAAHLVKRKFLSLSQGEARKALLARALAPLEETPALLLLDEASEGLDPKARSAFFHSIRTLLGPDSADLVGDVQLLYTTHRLEEIEKLSDVLTHALFLKNGQIAAQGPLNGHMTPEVLRDLYAPAAPAQQQSKQPAPIAPAPAPTPVSADEPLLEIRDTEYRIQGQSLLHVDSWRLLPGQNWAVLGANGAGKSTFLRLVYGDIPAYFSFEKPARILRFGQLEGACGSIPLNTLRKRMGFVSPALQAGLGYAISALELACSGMYAGLGAHRDYTAEEKERALAWLRFFELADLAGQAANTLSNGQLRRVLLARALANADLKAGPCVLLLDEPFSGLDPRTRQQFFNTLRTLPANGVSLVCAVHRREELIPECTHGLLLEKGRITTQGPLQDVLKSYAL